ncbi:hypothetical protein [Pseudonocardia pini]|uniref:hypothetical protein n=1 Tax=Pseudonocardia pini TaxID=2758030 RepID=UPI001C68D232|nr:hypothetical protein [Pseudonocardia pini]
MSEEIDVQLEKFGAKTELFGFVSHYDGRAGMGDTGPYPLPDGRFAIVRDHFLNETAYPWSGVAEGLPSCVTEMMIFPSDDWAWPVLPSGKAAEVRTPVPLFGAGFPNVTSKETQRA